MTLRAQAVSWSAGGTLIVDGVSLDVPDGATLGLLGPNGSGKSSLLRLLAGLRRPSDGAVLLDGADLAGLGRRAVARRLAVVEQQASTELDLTVEEVVRLGRIPHRGGWARASGDGDRASGRSRSRASGGSAAPHGVSPPDPVAHALQAAALTELAARRWHTLSGGEQQRVQIARALAQEPRELLLDEPTNHLDIRHQLDLLGLIRRLPLTTVVALHDLNLAATFCDRLVVLDAGRLAAAGTPADVLTPRLIADVYGVQAEVATTPDGRLTIRFLGPVATDKRPGHGNAVILRA